MKLKDLKRDQLRALAARVPTSLRYLDHLIASRRAPSVEMAIKIEQASGGTVPRESFRALPCARCKYLRECKKGN